VRGGETVAVLDSVRSFFKKQSQIVRLLVAINSGKPVWTDARFDKLAEEGYNRNVYVFRCVNQIAQACGGIPWVLYRKRGQTKEIEEHALLSLLQRPNPQQGQAKFIETAIAFLMLAGNSYIERVGPKGGAPRELYTLRPDRVLVIKGNHINPIGGYEYQVDGMKKTFEPELILHLRHFHPLDDWYGLSPIQAAARSIDQNNESKAWNVALLQNGARPSGALVTEQNFTDDQFNRVKGEVEEKYASAKNAGKPMVLEGGLDWKQIAMNAVDMDWLEGQKLSAREIAIAFGVPPELIGDSTSKTYSNYQEARQAFYMETVLPLMDWLRDEFNNWLTPLFGDRLYLDYDRDEIEAIQEDRASVWMRAITAVEKGVLTPNEAREVMGYEAHPAGDRLGDELNNEGEDEPSNDEPKSLEWKAFNLRSDEQKTAYWEAFERLRKLWEDATKEQISRLFEKEAGAVVRAAKQSPTRAGIVDQATAAIDVKAWETLFKAIYTGVMEDFGERTIRGLKSDGLMEVKAEEEPEELEPFSFSIWLTEALAFVASTVAEKVSQVTETTKNQIKEAVSIGLQEGESIEEIAERIDALYLDHIIPDRSVTIARTETLSASNAGSRYAAKATGLPLRKEWIATRDKRTRPSHRLLDGQIKMMDERYSNGLMFPGDPTGPPSEVIQCRCAEGYHIIEGGESDGV
jgi:HK97 family phage portal protein